MLESEKTPLAPAGFETLARLILEQQVSLDSGALEVWAAPHRSAELDVDQERRPKPFCQTEAPLRPTTTAAPG